MGPLLLCLLAAGCAPATYRQKSDTTAYDIIAAKQQEALGRTEKFSIEPPETTLRRRLLLDQQLPYSAPASLGSSYLEQIEHWPEKKTAATIPVPTTDAETAPRTITLIEALQIAAGNSRDYQSRKEDLFRTALNLDLERNNYRNTLSGQLQGEYSEDRSRTKTSGWQNSTTASLSRTLLNGLNFTGRIVFDLVQMLQPSQLFSRAIFSDASITVPLLRGSGRHIVTESLTQAERDMLYAVWEFERFKKEFATDRFASYLAVLNAEDQIRNQEENYQRLRQASRRASRLAEAGKTPQFQVDQAIQNELRARERWIAARQSYEQQLDRFKIDIGLPTDADIRIDRNEFRQLQEHINNLFAGLFQQHLSPTTTATDPNALPSPDTDAGGPMEMEQATAIRIALGNRLDLSTTHGRVYDAQRQVVVAADQLRPELSLFGSVNVGERRGLANAGADDNNDLNFSRGIYNSLLTFDPPLERTAEAHAYRDSYIALEQAVRALQEQEDQIKLEVRNNIRTLQQARESLKNQFQAVKLAERRVEGANLNLEAGRAEIRDLLEAQEALVNARNSLTSAMIDYRVAEIRMQADLGLLQVDNNGLLHEQIPGENRDAS